MMDLWGKVRDIILESELDHKDLTNLKKLLNKFSREYESKSKIEELLKQGVDVKYKDYLGWTLLHFAAKVGDIFIVSLLYYNGADMNAKNMFGNTPMHIAAHTMSPDHMLFVHALINFGADVNPVNDMGQTPYSIAVEMDNWQLVEFLKQKGVDSG